jgi:lipid-A-disaccharide synthase-like uncharacterized protein
LRPRSRIGFIVACLVVSLLPSPSVAEGQREVEVKLKIPGVHAVYLESINGAGDESFRYRVEDAKGTRFLTPEAFSRLIHDQHLGRPGWKVLLNVTGPIGIAWVGLGLLGQLLFTGRMLLQWLTSEKEGRSVIPNAFWWMSLAGASMLLVYFVWRKDAVGVLGQSTGWFIYARNLHLIHRNSESRSEQTALEEDV